MQNEYVVGGTSYFQSEILNPRRFNRAQLELDALTIERMRLDSEVSSSVEFIVDSMFAEGFQFSPTVEEDDPDYETAKEIADFCAKAIAAARRSIISVLREQTRATYYDGVKVGEIVLRYENNERFKNKYVLDRINLKPLRATAFVADPYKNVLGLVGAKRARHTFSSSRILLDSDEIIERRKFIVLAFELEDNDPRGLVPIRTAADGFRDKQTTRLFYREWLKRCAITQKVGTTAPGAESKPLQNPDTGEYITYPNGLPKEVSPQELMTQAMGEMENNSVISIPSGASITPLELQGTGEQFERSYKLANLEIRKSQLGDGLATGAADKDARAARESSMHVVDLKIKARKNSVCEAVKQDILTLLVEENYDQKYWHLVPNCSLGDTERRSWSTDLRAATGAGYRFTKKQMAEIDVQFSVKPRDEDDELANENESVQRLSDQLREEGLGDEEEE